MKYGATAAVNPCANKTDQILYDGKNNAGYCDCVIDERQLVYYNGECYEQNIQVQIKPADSQFAESKGNNYLIDRQGPCQNGSLLVLVNGKPTCELIPGNCTIDQVYWSPDPAIPTECHFIGQRGPCFLGHVITRDAAGVASCVISIPAETVVDSTTDISVAYAEPAATGPKRETKKAAVVEPSPFEPVPCPLGSYRYQINKCPT